jgi:hypothetical protein
MVHSGWWSSRWSIRSSSRSFLFNELGGAELCLAIVGQSRPRNHLLERMRVATIRHTEMAGELAMLRVVVTSATELVLGCSPDETF